MITSRFDELNGEERYDVFIHPRMNVYGIVADPLRDSQGWCERRRYMIRQINELTEMHTWYTWKRVAACPCIAVGSRNYHFKVRITAEAQQEAGELRPTTECRIIRE